MGKEKKTLINNKIILYIAIILILSLFITKLINDFTINYNSKYLTQDAIEKQFSLFTETIEKNIANMETAGNAISAGASMVYQSYIENPDTDYRKFLTKFLKDYLAVDNNAIGYGVWFEKDLFPNDPYVGPYVYKENNRIIETLEYETPEYDYPNSIWYTTILPKNWDREITRTKFYISPPFYDNILNKTFITMGRTVLDWENKIIGVVSCDWTIDFLEKIFINKKITEMSYPILLDTKSIILFHPDKTLVGKTIDNIPWSKDLLQTNFGVIKKMKVINSLNQDSTIFYTTISIGYHLGFVVPNSEIYNSQRVLIRNNLIALVFLLVTTAFIVYLLRAKELKKTNAELSNAQKEIETMLNNENEKLQTQIQIKTDELNETLNELYNREKLASLGALVAGISHEINTPLGISVTAATFLMENISSLEIIYSNSQITKTSLESFILEAKETSNILYKNLKRSSELIKSFKQIAVGQSMEEKTQVNLSSLITDTLVMLKHEYKNKNYSFSINCDKNINISSFPGAFTQILTNLIMNSFKHGFRDRNSGIISIDVHIENNYLIVFYGDNGVGINEAHKNRILDPFYTTNRENGSSGLGLSIVFNIVKSILKGNISYENLENGGLNFEIRIPLE